MLSPAPRAVSRTIRAARNARPTGRALLPLVLALATLLAQLVLPLAHLEERRQGTQRTGAVLWTDPAPFQHLDASGPREGLPHDAGRCAVCSATAQARNTLADAAPPVIGAPAAPERPLVVSAPRPPSSATPRRSAPPRAPPVPFASA